MIRHFISYPKSGRSWVRYALVELGIEEQISFHHDGFEFNNSNLPPLNFSFEKRIRKYRNGDRVVYLEREPKDVMVSLYYQVTGRFKDFFNYSGNISEFIRHEYFGAENLRGFRDMWNQLCEMGIAYKISYENLHDDFEGELAGLLNYYGFESPAEQISDAKRASSFIKMKEVEESNSFPSPWLRPRNEFPKVRKGKVGGYVDELSKGDIEYLDGIFYS